MQLTLLRHGESKHGVEQFIAGKSGCKGLMDKGIQQAEHLAQRLKKECVPCDVLLSTSVKRAQDTATIVGKQINRHVQINDDLCEVLPGDADGLTEAQYRQQYGEFDIRTLPDKPFSPNGESWNQFVHRVQTTLESLYHTYENQQVIAVTHAGFIVVSFLLLFNIPLADQRAQIHPGYASITEWHVSDGDWQLIRYNDTSHL